MTWNDIKLIMKVLSESKCIFVISLDQDNYQTLFGVLDNCFLVAYAIGMFIRFVCAGAGRSSYAFVWVCVLQWVIIIFLCSQWDVWRAPASAVLPEFWDADEWIVYSSVWPRLLLEHPLVRILRCHPGEHTAPQTSELSVVNIECNLLMGWPDLVLAVSIMTLIHKGCNVSWSVSHLVPERKLSPTSDHIGLKFNRNN